MTVGLCRSASPQAVARGIALPAAHSFHRVAPWLAAAALRCTLQMGVHSFNRHGLRVCCMLVTWGPEMLKTQSVPFEAHNLVGKQVC